GSLRLGAAPQDTSLPEGGIYGTPLQGNDTGRRNDGSLWYIFLAQHPVELGYKGFRCGFLTAGSHFVPKWVCLPGAVAVSLVNYLLHFSQHLLRGGSVFLGNLFDDFLKVFHGFPPSFAFV